MDVMGQACSIGSEVVELRQSLATVTEALILFQEFIESEIGEMSYFRDSGSYNKLVDTLNKLRPRVRGSESRTSVSIQQRPPPPPGYHYQYHHQPVVADYNPNHYNMDGLMMISQACDVEMKSHRTIPAPVITSTMQGTLVQRDDEQTDVNVDTSEDDVTGVPIVINQVYSVSPPPNAEQSGNFENPTVMQQQPEHVKETNHFVEHRTVIMDANQLMTQNQNQSLMMNNGQNQPQIRGQTQSIIATAPPAIPPAGEERVVPSMGSPSRTNQSINRDTHKRGRKPSKHSSMKGMKKVKSKGVIMHGTVNSGAASGLAAINKLDVKTKAAAALNRKSRKFLERPVKCLECSKSYSSRGVMSRHMKEVHQKDPQFTCFYCPLKFRNGPMRLEHMSTVHPNDMSSITCPYCNRKSQSVAGKRNHMMLCAKKCGSPDDGEAAA